MESATARGRVLSVRWASVCLLVALWGWAIWATAEHWQANPNYSYGWAVPLLMIGFAVRRYFINADADVGLARRSEFSLAVTATLAFAAGALVFALEYAREQVWHPIVVIWSIALLTIGVTLALCKTTRGVAFARTQIFPVCFFLTAVPWPPRFEQPITSTLMRWVALATTEILHWLGVPAQAAGGAIALRNGLVGVTEACSGIRSLQAGVMFGLAMGEWFLLNATRRVILLVIAIAFAGATNLARTLALTLQASAHGVESVERVHDFIGNIMITALMIAIWIAGKLLVRNSPVVAASGDRHRPSQPAATKSTSLVFASLTIGVVAGLIAARALAAHIEARDKTQTTPFFSVIPNGASKSESIPRMIWNELHPTTGEYIRHENIGLSRGTADCFHFFWKPSPWNRFALVHRPDICMPGIGWESDGRAQTREVQLDGRALRFYLFRFHRGNVHALELWGAWRNGEPVPIDYRPDQVLGAAPAPTGMSLEGKRKSATEIVSCSVMSEDGQPAVAQVIETLRAVFRYNPR
jgi:exosortase